MNELNPHQTEICLACGAHHPLWAQCPICEMRLLSPKLEAQEKLELTPEQRFNAAIRIAQGFISSGDVVIKTKDGTDCDTPFPEMVLLVVRDIQNQINLELSRKKPVDTDGKKG